MRVRKTEDNPRRLQFPRSRTKKAAVWDSGILTDIPDGSSWKMTKAFGSKLPLRCRRNAPFGIVRSDSDGKIVQAIPALVQKDGHVRTGGSRSDIWPRNVYKTVRSVKLAPHGAATRSRAASKSIGRTMDGKPSPPGDAHVV